MLVVSDTSPVINLAMLGHIHLLQQLYGVVAVPPAVRHEIVVSGAGQAGSRELDGLDWVQVQPVMDRNLVRVLRLLLDEGEAEVIALALETQPDLVLLDERKARAVALKLDLPLAGVLDVYVAAKRRGLIAAVKPAIEDLMRLAHFRIGKRLYASVLRAAGESHDV